MDRFSICEFSTCRWSFLEDVARYSAYGFKSLGLWRKKLQERGEAEALDLLHDHQVSVSSVQWAGNFTGSSGRSYTECLEDGYDAISLTARLGAECLIIHPGALNGHLTKHAMRLAKSGLKNLVQFATDYDVRLAIEPMLFEGSLRWSFLNQFEDYLTLMSDYSAEQVGMVLDLYHVGTSDDVFHKLDSLRDRIALVQLADRGERIAKIENRCPLGNGNLPIATWLQELNRIGYCGMYEIELHGFDMQKVDYFHLLDETADYLAELDLNSKTEKRNPRIQVSE